MKKHSKLYTLHPGDVVCSERDTRMETLLGSCVSIVLTDPRRTVGVMSHIVHTSYSTSAKSVSGAFGDVAFDMMFKLLMKRGIDPLQCHAYVYGGGNMFPHQLTDFPIGERNACWALDQLAHEGIHVVYHDVGGAAYRRLSWTVGPDAPGVVAVPIAVSTFA
jgi:chemotaxis protein CheD